MTEVLTETMTCEETGSGTGAGTGPAWADSVGSGGSSAKVVQEVNVQ